MFSLWNHGINHLIYFNLDLSFAFWEDLTFVTIGQKQMFSGGGLKKTKQTLFPIILHPGGAFSVTTPVNSQPQAGHDEIKG